jgi:hypothetical protein
VSGKLRAVQTVESNPFGELMAGAPAKVGLFKVKGESRIAAMAPPV